MSSNPWVNEPGFEEDDEGGGGRYRSGEAKAYSAKIHHETINITILKRLEKYLGIPTPRTQAEQRTAAAFNPAVSDDAKSSGPFEGKTSRLKSMTRTDFGQIFSSNDSSGITRHIMTASQKRSRHIVMRLKIAKQCN